MRFNRDDVIQRRHWEDQHPFKFADCPVCQLPRDQAKMMANGRCPTCWLGVIIPGLTKCQWDMGCRSYASETVHVKTDGPRARHMAYCPAHHALYVQGLELMRANKGTFRI